MTRIFIDGAAGTTGLEILARLEPRAEFSLIRLSDAERKDEGARRDALRAADVAILCLPDDAAREAVALIGDADTRVIDASSAHRVADGWTYGFPELVGRDAVARARRVSNPGCYPTGFLALVAPLVRAGLLPADYPLTVNAVSGYSGGGKALIERFEAARESGDGAIAWRGYGFTLDHKHLPEMQVHAGLAFPPVFAPAVVAGYRGMVVEVPLNMAALDADGAALREALGRQYEGSQVVRLQEGDGMAEMLLHQGGAANDALDLFVFESNAGKAVRLVARLDNLGKGASGAAVQSLNLMTGLDETAGLALPD
mgnify:CR=1 FL=1